MTTLYEKRGRRYYPVRETEALDGLGEGSWVVTVQKDNGSTLTSIQRAIEPAYVEVLAAVAILSRAMSEAMRKACQLSPKSESLTKKEKEAYKAFCDIMGENALMAFKGVSMADVVAAGVEKLQEKFFEKK